MHSWEARGWAGPICSICILIFITFSGLRIPCGDGVDLSLFPGHSDAVDNFAPKFEGEARVQAHNAAFQLQAFPWMSGPDHGGSNLGTEPQNVVAICLGNRYRQQAAGDVGV